MDMAPAPGTGVISSGQLWYLCRFCSAKLIGVHMYCATSLRPDCTMKAGNETLGWFSCSVSTEYSVVIGTHCLRVDSGESLMTNEVPCSEI